MHTERENAQEVDGWQTKVVGSFAGVHVGKAGNVVHIKEAEKPSLMRSIDGGHMVYHHPAVYP